MRARWRWYNAPWGLAAALYLLATYSTLPWMPAVWRALDEALAGNGVIGIYAGSSAALTLVAGRSLYVRPGRRAWALSALAGCAAGWTLLGMLESNPGEKIHMLQYGLFGVLVYFMLHRERRVQGSALYATALVVGLLAGWLDELIQGMLPNRHYTWHDVLVNGASAMLGTLAARFCLVEPVAPATREGAVGQRH